MSVAFEEHMCETSGVRQVVPPEYHGITHYSIVHYDMVWGMQVWEELYTNI